MILAFYKALGRPTDWAIRAATWSRYSHVEIIPRWTVDAQGRVWSVAASKRDGGMVRFRPIRFKAGHWHFIEGIGDPDLAMAAVGLPYDTWGAVLSCTPGLARKRPAQGLWFCSELAAHVEGLPDPQTYHPGRLADALLSRV